MPVEEIRIKHLEMIQGVMNRLAGNSFVIKGWSITLISALIVVAVDKGSGLFVFVGMLPAITFWILDGYFLWQENLFGQLFEEVRNRHLDDPEKQLSMDTHPYSHKVPSWRETTLQIGKRPNTLFLFHGAIIFAILISSIIIH